MTPAADALAGRVVLLTGAHGGLGEAAARACAAAGATVVLLGRRVPKLNRVYDAIEAAGGPTPAIYPLDLEGAGPTDYEQLAETIERECGRLDGILHAAADFKGLMSLAGSAPEDLLRAIHVNLTAPLLLTRACLPLLSQREDASVVFVLDDLDRLGRAHWGGYGLAKHALADLPVGGTTPLSSGSFVSYEVIRKEKAINPDVMPLMIVLTDGAGNVSLMTNASPNEEAYKIAKMIKEDDIRTVTINMEHAAFDQGLAAKLADHLGGPCYSLAQLRAETLLETVRQAIDR